MKIAFDLLTAKPPHNENRDEDGRPKTAIFGGVVRGRTSSQAKKRAMRFSEHFEGHQRAVRTRQAGVEAYMQLREAGVDWPHAAMFAEMVNFALGGTADKPAKTGKEWLAQVAEKLNGDAPLPTDEPAAAEATPPEAEASQAGEEQPAKAAKGRGKTKTTGKSKLHPEFVKSLKKYRGVMGEGSEEAVELARQETLETDQGLVVSVREFANRDRLRDELIDLRRNAPEKLEARLFEMAESMNKVGALLSKEDADLDTALFGRMVASAPDFNVHAACAVGHAITTHEFSVEGDYFSAGEELNVLKGTGAAITSYAYFGSGVYHQHAVLDLDALAKNIGSASLEEAVRALLDGLVYAQPRGKRNSHADATVAAFVIASVGEDPSCSGALAFLEPVRPKDGTNLMAQSIERLREFHRDLRQAYGLKDEVAVFNGWTPRKDNAPKDGEMWDYEAFRDWVVARASTRRGAAA